MKVTMEIWQAALLFCAGAGTVYAAKAIAPFVCYVWYLLWVISSYFRLKFLRKECSCGARNLEVLYTDDMRRFRIRCKSCGITVDGRLGRVIRKWNRSNRQGDNNAVCSQEK